MRTRICLLMLIFSSVIIRPGFSENETPKSATISGFIRDSKTGETLTGAVIYPKENPAIGITSNSYGYFSLTLPTGKYTLIVQFLGYKTQTVALDLKENMKLTFDMDEESIALQEIQNIPVILGEKDILKTIQLLPGVTPAGEGNAGFYVRGGGVDQNLILLDEAPVYNPSHLLGFFSTFNSDAIKDITLYKGGFPAESGGLLSSAVFSRET